MSEQIDKLKERLTNELGDKLRSVEMDVTSSFLSGKICSPLLATVDNASMQAQAIARGTLNAAAKAGLYITKDGLRYDPTVMTDTAGLIVNSAMQSAMSELVRLKDNAIREITYIPDPSLIVKKAISYFAYNVQNEIKINELLDDLHVDEDKKEEERKEEHVNKTFDKINKFITYQLPKVSYTINTVSYNINNAVSTATAYMSFGPEWVSENVAYYIADGSYIAETFLNDKTKKLNDYKMELYNRAAKSISDEMTKQYEELIKQNVKEINDEQEVGKAKAKSKAMSLIQKANLAIMSKTGIKIPINKISAKNLSKLKRAAKLSKLLGLAAQAIPQNGPKDSNSTTNDKTASGSEKYPKILLEKRLNQLDQLSKGLLNEITKIDDKIKSIRTNDFYDPYSADEITSLENEKQQLQNIKTKANVTAEEIIQHISLKPLNDEALDELMKNTMNILTQNSYASSSEKMMVWDNDADGYVEVSNAADSDTVTVVGKRKQEESIPEMYAQNFMNADGNGPVNM